MNHHDKLCREVSIDNYHQKRFNNPQFHTYFLIKHKIVTSEEVEDLDEVELKQMFKNNLIQPESTDTKFDKEAITNIISVFATCLVENGFSTLKQPWAKDSVYNLSQKLVDQIFHELLDVLEIKKLFWLVFGASDFPTESEFTITTDNIIVFKSATITVEIALQAFFLFVFDDTKFPCEEFKTAILRHCALYEYYTK